MIKWCHCKYVLHPAYVCIYTYCIVLYYVHGHSIHRSDRLPNSRSNLCFGYWVLSLVHLALPCPPVEGLEPLSQAVKVLSAMSFAALKGNCHVRLDSLFTLFGLMNSLILRWRCATAFPWTRTERPPRHVVRWYGTSSWEASVLQSTDQVIATTESCMAWAEHKSSWQKGILSASKCQTTKLQN